MTVSRTIMGFILAFALGVAITGIVSQFRLDAEREAGRGPASNLWVLKFAFIFWL